MVLPSDDEFKAFMIDYIRQHFSEILGEDSVLLSQEDGLEKLSEITRIKLLAQQL